MSERLHVNMERWNLHRNVDQHALYSFLECVDGNVFPLLMPMRQFAAAQPLAQKVHL